MKTFTKVALILSCTLVTLNAYTHGGATGVVKERMDAMDNMADATKRVADMYKGKSEFSKEIIADAVASFKEHGDKMSTLFPDTQHSRTGSQTDALSKIWLTPDVFRDQIEKFISANNALDTALNKGVSDKQLKKQFFLTTKTCSNCHKLFRKPKDK